MTTTAADLAWRRAAAASSGAVTTAGGGGSGVVASSGGELGRLGLGVFFWIFIFFVIFHFRMRPGKNPIFACDCAGRMRRS
jgi:hypothetical protein